MELDGWFDCYEHHQVFELSLESPDEVSPYTQSHASAFTPATGDNTVVI